MGVNVFEWLDIWNILVNEIFGTLTLFLLISNIVVIMICQYFNMDFRRTMLLLSLWNFIIIIWSQNLVILTITLIIIGTYIYGSIVDKVRG